MKLNPAVRSNLLLAAIFISAGLFIHLPVASQQYTADHSVAREEVLRSIPVEYINKARTELVIAYQHTSHGTHVSRGVAGLQDYKSGDEVLFGVSASPDAGKLEFRDYALEDYAPEGVTAIDLSVDETAFIQTTRNYLDAPENATVNVIMWSWCDISGHAVGDNYLPGMASLISEYGPGGTMIGTGPGQRELPVSFIYMTGHANKDDNTGSRNPKEQAALIIDYCNTNSQFCLDYYSIDTHAMDGTYYEDAGDDGDSDSYGGNFYQDWQDAHTLGVDYFENKRVPGGEVVYGEHNSQHITANRKAYAMWWILARIAGWQEEIMVTSITISAEGGATSMVTGGELQFSASVLPMEATNPSVTWSIVNGSGSATISSGGLVTAVSAGTVQVVATATDGSMVSDTFSLTIANSMVLVSDILISSEGDATEVDAGSTLQFTASVLPSDATSRQVSWSVNNLTGTGTICECGTLTAVSEGTVEVVATARDDSNVSDTFAVTIGSPTGLPQGKTSSNHLLYPNPSTGVFYLDAGNRAIRKIEVISAEGRMILHSVPEPGQRIIAVDLSDRSPGLFFIHTYTKEGSTVERLIITR